MRIGTALLLAAAAALAPTPTLVPAAAAAPTRAPVARVAAAAPLAPAPVRTVPSCSGCGRVDLSAGAVPGARAALRRLTPALGLRRDGSDLRALATRRTPEGTAVRFAQLAGGVPVRDAQVVVLLRGDGSVGWAASSASPGIEPATTVASVPPGRAEAIARARVPGGDLRSPPRAELVVAPRPDGRGVLAWDVHVDTAAPWHDWRVLLSAATGAVLDVGDQIRAIDGTGAVYDPNPVQGTGDTRLTDGNDATTFALDDARVAVTLPDLAAGTKLTGTYADMTTALGGCTLPYTPGAASSLTRAYTYTRNDDRFEEANAYSAITRTARLYQQLGFTTVMDHPVHADVHCMSDDNSYYSPGDGALRFGDGGVDDAEDADIVLHEYGHATQDDQVPGFGPTEDSEQGAIGEGFGDLLAVMMSIDRGSAAWQGTGDGGMRFCVGEWDQTPSCLRRTDGLTYDGDPLPSYSGSPTEVHDDGQYWSAALTCVFRGMEDAPGATLLGARDDLLRLVLAHHERLVADARAKGAFADSADALLDADRSLFAGAHVALIAGCTEQWLGVAADLDTTPPQVTPAVTPAGPDAASGWYRGDVTVTWAVADPDSSVTQAAGCASVVVDEDTPGRTITCTATSGGGTTTKAVTIRRDATPPVLAPALTPPAPALGEPAVAEPNAADGTSGVAQASCDAAGTEAAGSHTVACRAVDVAGNAATATVDYQVTGTSAPPVRLRLTRARALPDGSVTVTARADGDVVATIAAVGPRGVRLRSAPIALHAGKARPVRLTGPRRSRSRLRSLLRRKPRSLTLTITLRDVSGDPVTRKASLRLARRR